MSGEFAKNKGEFLIIRADASTPMGSGHLMRCLALAQAWKDAGGKVIFITACQNESLLQRLRDEEFELHMLPQSHPDGIDWEHTREVFDAHPDAWVVLDGYHFDEVYQQRVKEAEHRLLVIDDMAHLKHYYADMVLNQNLHAEQLHYPGEPYTRLLLGAPYVLLKREFLAWRGWQREIPAVAKRVLVTLGGSDPENYTLKIIKALQKVEIPGLEAVAVVGASNPHAKTLEEIVGGSRVPIRLNSDARNMPELMAWADVAVSMGGITSWELLFLGTPAIFIISAENQRRIAEQIGEEGAGRNLGSVGGLSTKQLADALTSILKDSKLRGKMGKKARQTVDGKGTERLLKLLQKKAESPITEFAEIASTAQSLQGQNLTKGLKVFFLGGKQAGCIGLLTLAAKSCKIQGAIAYDVSVGKLAEMLNIPLFSSIKQPEVENSISQSDLLVSVHGREIVPKKLLELPPLGGINVHPCLYCYKGANPIGRLLQDGCSRASVGVHRMTENIDEGEVLVEEFIDIAGKQTVEEVYNALYPLYSLALLKALQILDSLQDTNTRTE